MGIIQKTLLYAEVTSFLGKALVLCELCELGAELADFCLEHIFTWKNNWDKLWLFRLEYLAGIFLKMSKVSLSFQGRQLAVFVASENIWAFQVLEF